MDVAIIGRPNVGKSALFNRLIGRKVAIVHNQPGITRDRISAVCARGSRPFTLWDTGGVFGAGELELTSQVRRAAEEALGESDLILFLVDAKDGLSPIDQDLARMLRKSQKPIVLVVNKIDTEKHEPLAADFDSLGFDTSVSVSAEHNRGISELLDKIDALLLQGTAISKAAPSTSAAWKPPLLEQDVTAIAIIGRPNVGKSSLINSLVQSERALVSELPGTTRDAIDIFYQRGDQKFLFIDTAGIRRRGKQTSSVEVFSVMRAERSIHRADLCVLIVDLTSGVTAQDKRIAGLIQKAHKAAAIVLNKWDLVKPRPQSRRGSVAGGPKRREKQVIKELVDETYARLFFLDYAPVLVASARTGENIQRLFGQVEKAQRASQARIGTGVLNRLLRAAFTANPPPMVKGKRLKLFYAAQAGREHDGLKPSDFQKRQLQPPEFVLFVNNPHLLPRAYARYLEAQIRGAEPFTGLPILLTLRPRSEKL